MSLPIKVVCPECNRPIEAEFAGDYTELLTNILKRAGHQEGDTTFKELMEQLPPFGE